MRPIGTVLERATPFTPPLSQAVPEDDSFDVKMSEALDSKRR